MERAPLDTSRLQAALADRWARVQVVSTTESTNADLVAELLAHPETPDRCALAAEYQSAGRGRLDRTWSSPPRAGLTVSVLLRPPVTLARWGWLPLLAGVAVQDAVQGATAITAGLKWPNDVLSARGGEFSGKLAGILAQTAADAVVIGIGLNVSTTVEELPDPDATSLALELAADLDRTALLVAVLTDLESRYAQWVDCDGDAAACGLAAAYRQRCVTLGRQVRVSLAGDGGTLEGEAVDVDDLGRLLVRTDDGTRSVGAGDVQHVRAS